MTKKNQQIIFHFLAYRRLGLDIRGCQAYSG